MIASKQDLKDIKEIASTDLKRGILTRVFTNCILQGTSITAPEIRQAIANLEIAMRSEEEEKAMEKQMNPAV